MDCFFNFSCCCVGFIVHDFLVFPVKVMVVFPAMISSFVSSGISSSYSSGVFFSSLCNCSLDLRSQSYFDANIVSLGTLPTICEVLQKYDLFDYFDTRFSDSVFPTYLSWKAIVKTKIRELEENAWIDFVQKHPSFKFARTCLDNVSPHKFWSISDQYPDLVSRLHV